ARKHYYNLLNLNPKSENAHKALNRVGDTYMLQGSYEKALAVFDESSKKLVAKLNKDGKPEVDKEKKVVLEDSPETQYGKIRMADIGIRSPRIKVNDIVFDVANYYKPFSAYEKVFQEAKNEKILAEVTLSRGIAYLLEQNYLRAIGEFKKLFPLGSESRYAQEAERFVKQALIALVDKYSKQNGTLPILYSYSDFVSLPITNIKNPKTLLQVGEAYQAIGMLPEAVKFYEKVKIFDSEKIYRDRIFLNLGKIHLKEKNFNEAILVGRSFIKNFPRSKRLNEAKKLMAQANKGNGNLLNAITIYKELIGLSENTAEIHYLIAEAKTELKKYAEAAISYQNAIAEYDRKERVIPDYIQKSYYHLGTSLYKINKFKAAIEAFNSAKELFPENPLKDWADYLLIESYKQQEETDKSKEEINRLVDAKNADPILKRTTKSSANIAEWEKQLKEG
ncbi:MAG: tetratricopeptide repeat protein, partial [Nitrospinota bacterium]|nr:tetratricopeptide repeat protein [Nitrospinota bacterium]